MLRLMQLTHNQRVNMNLNIFKRPFLSRLGDGRFGVIINLYAASIILGGVKKSVAALSGTLKSHNPIMMTETTAVVS